MKLPFGALIAAFIVAAATDVMAAPEASGPEPDAILRNLYKAHEAEKGPFFDRENRAALEQYFTKELAALILKDAIESQGEVGALEADPLYESQDPRITDLQVGEVKRGEGGTATADVVFKDSGTPRRIGFRFETDAKGTWKIADIKYPDGRTIVGILRGGDAAAGDESVETPRPSGTPK